MMDVIMQSPRTERGASATERGERTRRRMVRGAAELLRQRGYTGTGFREVIAATGAPRGSIYHHFPGGKAQLAREAVDYVAGYAREAIREPLEGGDPIGALRAFVSLWLADFERSGYRAGCPIAAVAVESHEDAPELLASAADAFARWQDAFDASLVTAGVPAARADRLANLVVSAVEGAIVISRAQRSSAPLESAGRELEAILADALADRSRT
jgi:AcrR family transcriptional regulator